MEKPLSKNEKNNIFKPFKFKGNEYPILITELKNTNSPDNIQELVFYGVPSVSTGKQNARYSAVSDAIYSFAINKELFNDIANEKANKLNLLGDERDKYIKSLFISEGERYYHRDNNNLPNKYNFTITSQHYYKSGDLFKLACSIIIDKLENFKENMINFTQKNECSITITNHTENIYYIYASNQNDTLGNIIQSHMSNHFLQPTDFLNTCGYKKTHPLEETILFIVSINQSNKGFTKNEEQKINLLVSYFELVINDLITIYKEIQKQSSILL
jgi:DNA-directed RNA polymerase subunit L